MLPSGQREKEQAKAFGRRKETPPRKHPDTTIENRSLPVEDEETMILHKIFVSDRPLMSGYLLGLSAGTGSAEMLTHGERTGHLHNTNEAPKNKH